MTPIYLFDWGNTLMVDFPNASGKMCDWRTVQALEGAEETLAHLSRTHEIHVATSAADSSERDIRRALERVGLDRYVEQCFCANNLGLSKSDPGFFEAILDALHAAPDQVTMVGDDYEKDIAPALRAGMNAVWLRLPEQRPMPSVTSITDLRQLRR